MTVGRAGRYMQQPQGYRAFIPNDLPPVPEVSMDDEMWTLLSQADRALGRLDGATETLPNPDLFVYMYVRKEAVLSSQIEGTQASLLDVLAFESQSQEPETASDVGEVINYIAALNHGLSRLRELPVSLRLIREIHGELLAGVRGGDLAPGEYRRTQNWVGPPGCTLATATYVPPPPQEMLRSLDNLERFLHDESPMPALVKVGLIHAQLETIHPFLDGNGRIGRLLITFLLCERGILKRPLLYLSFYFKQHRGEYYDHLQAIRDLGDWEGWLKFFLRGVYQVAQEATETGRQIVRLRETHRELIAHRLGRSAGRALGLLEALYQQPVVSVQSVMKTAGLSFANANTLIKHLCDLAVLREITGRRRDRRFSYDAYLQLFHDPETGVPEVRAG